MIHNTLVCHSGVSCSAVQQLSVEIVILPGKGLHLCYYLQGNMSDLRIPGLQPSGQLDGLWEHTCFEAFFAVAGDNRYQEFNFSPSRQWATYLFTDYRIRNHWQTQHNYKISVSYSDDELLLNVMIPLTDLPLINADKTILLGLTAVIEATDGNCSYWALHHPLDTPDFHHRAGFVCELEPNSF